MDVRSRPTTARRPDRQTGAPGTGTFSPQHVLQILGEWQARELRVAGGFAECRGLSTEQLEDVYQETALALRSRPYGTEEHLRNALRTGLKHRALNLRRDERRRGQILAHSAPSMHILAEARAGQDTPELAAVLRQDRLIVSEFLAELSAIEQRVFWLLAEGMQYRAIAPALGINLNAARNASRACERKRERFQLLYDTGRLCGFRARTIQALQSGQTTSDDLAELAFAHLKHCVHCRAEHKTNARRLRRTFQGQAAALLPVPVLIGRQLGWLARLDVRLRTLQHRLTPDGLPFGSGGVRERAATLLAGGGAAAKVAAGVATVAVIAGGTIGATRVLDHSKAAQHRHLRSHSAVARPRASTLVERLSTAPFANQPVASRRTVPHTDQDGKRFPGHVVSNAPRENTGQSSTRNEPGGFAYLGVPTTTPLTKAPAPARTASHTGGGAFSP
jgi:RNA polymerase sigma factor (sigma-70 family)